MTPEERSFRNAVILFAILEALFLIPFVVYVALHHYK
jgi:hypothetical protein